MRQQFLHVSLDQEKAFDRVNRSFLLNLLVSVGFGPDFCRWIATLYNGAYMRIILNNWLTERISLERGVRQGDPLSPLLYVLSIEVLANLIRVLRGLRDFFYLVHVAFRPRLGCTLTILLFF